MNFKTAPDKSTPETNLSLTIHVVGKSDIQNQLLASFLEESMGVHCERHYDICLPVDSGHPGPLPLLLLVDCQGRKNIDPWDEYDLGEAAVKQQCYLTFYNVHPGAKIEAMALKNGIRGIFYRFESFKSFPKGLHAILHGELWFSRKILTDLLRSKKTSVSVKTDLDERLTHREKEILLKIATGASSHEISEAFFISTHTVKSHIYSIYKKIRVNNRFQASLWAVKYLNESAAEPQASKD